LAALAVFGVALAFALLHGRPNALYTGKGADVIYELMPSLPGMRAAQSKYFEVPADRMYAGGWSAEVPFYTQMTVEEAEKAIRAELAGRRFTERRNARGDLCCWTVHPPRGYDVVAVTVLGVPGSGPEGHGRKEERAVLDVIVQHS
jgi:hypothetical protein